MTKKDDVRDLSRLNKRIARENSNLFARLAAIYAASRKQAQHMLQDCDHLSIVEWRTLWDLHEAGAMTISDLAACQRTDQSQLSRSLPEMRRKGLVSMSRSTEDRRQTIVALTEAGQETFDHAAPVMARRRAALRRKFSDEELATFLGFLDRLEDFVRLPAQDFAEEETAK